MALGYGSTFKPVTLSKNSIGVIPQIDNRPDLGVLSWVLTGLEIAVGLLTGGSGLLVTTALAAVGTASQLGIEYAETGKVTPLSAGIGVAGLLLPGVFKGVGFVKQGNAIANKVEPILEQVIHDVDASIVSLENQAFGLANQTEQQLFNQINEGQNIYNSLAELKDKNFINPKQFRRVTDDLKKLGFKSKSLEKLFEVESSIRYDKALKEASKSTSEKLKRNLMNKYGLTVREVEKLLKLVVNETIVNKAAWFKILRASYARTSNIALGKILVMESATKSNALFRAISKRETIAMFASRMVHKTISQFNRVAGWIASPSSLVSEIVSKTLGKLSSKWEGVAETLAERLKIILSKGAKTAIELEAEFERTGGRLLKSKVIMGYKPIMVEGVLNTILIQFKPAPTNNKRPVVVTLSDSKLKSFVNSPSKMRWYLSNIARARNGHPYNSTINDGGDLMDYLGFLPSQAIGEALSVISASKGLANSLKTGSSAFHDTYWKRGLSQALVSSLASEAAKIIGNTFTGGGEIIKTTIEDSVKGVIRGNNIANSFNESFKGAFGQDARRKFEKGAGSNTNRVKSKIEPIKSIRGVF